MDKHTSILNRLVEVSMVLNSSLSIDRILTQLMDATKELLEVESASVILLDSTTNELYFVAMPSDTAHSDKLVRMLIPLKGSIAGSIILENKAVVLDDVSQHPLHFRSTDDESGFKTRSLLGVPMRIKDRVVGALEAVNKFGDRWIEHDEFYLEILAGQAAIALENAQLVDKLQKANKELAELDKLKSDFIAIASHELRTPLGVIMGYASFLKEEAKGELGDHANVVLNSALRMRDLIEDMTNLSFLNLAESELHRNAFRVRDMIDQVRMDVMTSAEYKGHSFEIVLSDEYLELDGDREKITMMLKNILHNAVRFSAAKAGSILVKCIDYGNEIRFQVSDRGIGIAKDKQEDVFKPFYQVEDHMTRRYGGMGLGLAIAKGVVEAHRGRIWLESVLGEGTTFYISLPR